MEQFKELSSADSKALSEKIAVLMGRISTRRNRKELFPWAMPLIKCLGQNDLKRARTLVENFNNNMAIRKIPELVRLLTASGFNV